VVFLLALILIISLLAKRLAVKIASDMTYLVSSGMLNLNTINQLSALGPVAPCIVNLSSP